MIVPTIPFEQSIVPPSEATFQHSTPAVIPADNGIRVNITVQLQEMFLSIAREIFLTNADTMGITPDLRARDLKDLQLGLCQ